MKDIETQRGRHQDPDRLDGFPCLAQSIAEDPEAAVFHKFDDLSAQNLLYLQSNLNDLRTKLGVFDRVDAEKGLRDTRIQLSAKGYSDLKSEGNIVPGRKKRSRIESA